MANTKPFGAPVKFIELGHSRVPYYRVGHGPDVLFLHGWPLYSATFRDIVPRLAEHYTCHLIDLPGAGDSEWSKQSKIGLREHAESVRSVVQQLGLHDFAIVAHDSGALIAQLVAADNAGVRGLVLGNTEIAGHRCWQVQVFVALERTGLGALMFGALLQFKPLRHSSIAYGGCFGDPEYAEGEFGRVFMRRMTRHAIAGHRRLLQRLDWSAIDELAQTQARIAAPTKFVWGAEDPYFPLRKLKPTLGNFPGEVTLGLIDKGKLFAHDEYPEAFAAQARELLDRCFGALTRTVTVSH